MRYAILLDIPDTGFHDDEQAAMDMGDNLGSVDMERVIAQEICEREMLLNDGIEVTILDVQQVTKRTRHLRKLLAVAALTLGFTVSMWTGQSHAEASAVSFNRECRYGLGVKAMRKTVLCVADRLDRVSSTTAMAVARRESGFHAHAYNSYSSAAGVYQHLTRFWAGRYRANSPRFWGRMPSSVFNGRTNIIVSLTMVQRGGWGPWL